jgi:hypothetical protein
VSFPQFLSGLRSMLRPHLGHEKVLSFSSSFVKKFPSSSMNLESAETDSAVFENWLFVPACEIPQRTRTQSPRTRVPMRKTSYGKTLIVPLAAAVLWMAAAYAEGPIPTTTAALHASTGISPAPAALLVLAAPVEPADPCSLAETAANPTRPAWDYAASTTQCGIVETDYGFLGQSMGGRVGQRTAATSLRYGLTPKLDLRWGLTNRIFQSGAGTPSLEGVGDQWLSTRYRFREQGRVAPAMAFLYGVKIPMANPVKGFGSGFVDHQLIFIASRDLGHYHLDFNMVGTVLGERGSHDGAAQFGLAVTRPITKKLSCILEGYGGPQPGTSDRFGAGFAGATYTLRPQLVLDGAYTRTYTADSPRQQVLFGVSYAKRPGFATMPRSSALARLLGR